ncbi:MAG TPA: response regulator, partial [Pseudomonadales bacterium]|nr:response regulator [Pseudomonadales bacterium]
NAHNPMEGLNILVIDDDPSLLSALATLLDDWRCRSLTAESIDTALSAMKTQQFCPDIILSDYRLGGGATGIDAVRAIREITAKDTAAILMTGDTDPALVKKIRDQKFFLLHKPVKPVQLRKSIGKLLSSETLI